MANVRLENITRRYQNVTAIENISFKIPDGEFWVLVGPSGCGKSTIMRTIAGLETATYGNIYIGDNLVNNIPARQRDVAMVFQNYALYPHMTVAENLAFGLRMRNVEQSQIQERVEIVARSLSIDHLLNRKPKQLSGGQQQRVALGRAIAREPKVFLLDEPLSNLDAQLRDDTRAELKLLHQRLGITTVYVTHDQVEAMTLADKIVVLNHGVIQQIGDPQSVYAKPVNRMVATFLGNPAMNILPAIYANESFQVGNQSLACPPSIQKKLQPREGQGFDLGIRPEHIELFTQSVTENDDFKSDVWALEKVPLEVEVKVVEPLGRETLIRASLPMLSPETTIQMQVAAGVRSRSGDRLSVQLDFDRLFVFDPSTGDALYP
ncbi:MAG: ABC transporter ATP-binding protein [Tychonema bourrellyi B0820]|uniref:ABC transporter ATP-binding protein n=1 Tax=Tychonema bourrellyi FEM_GT703 TaxID=2040638 RepID=A0A2G4F5V0_9CYAN|nr:ABC transporter ATP-binding protein [Tychonema bourrellyi]MDQ2099679.1 ABC transporter ATP-binding protein [Tychonema bourrellyi B0820]PHX57164.1 ABC transporter ATP-binding protein [Tychonema bourrellyi FEM_GT703]